MFWCILGGLVWDVWGIQPRASDYGRFQTKVPGSYRIYRTPIFLQSFNERFSFHHCGLTYWHARRWNMMKLLTKLYAKACWQSTKNRRSSRIMSIPEDSWINALCTHHLAKKRCLCLIQRLALEAPSQSIPEMSKKQKLLWAHGVPKVG